ncbi:MAG: tRNA threonylcarbamoyladenosine dehydratase [Candidatus Thiodiazotropha sp.]|jgi:tRNA threonylcarbamoyladenosine dehydratase
MGVMDYSRRFGGVGRLYGQQGLERFAQAHVAVVGVGGVGSWAVEALARSGIGKLSLYDLDHVAESNLNRQLTALDETLGMAKVQVMSRRIHAINPDCVVTSHELFIEQDKVDLLSQGGYDYVVDCIDNFRVKAAMIAACRRAKVPLVTVGGAGGQSDPTQIRLADLSRSEHDPLLSRTRKLLRQQYGFSTNLKRRFHVPCVYSLEQQRLPVFVAESCASGSPAGVDGSLNCAGYGSVMSVTASFGLVAVSHVLDKLAGRGG